MIPPKTGGAGGTTPFGLHRGFLPLLITVAILWIPGLRGDLWLDEIWTVEFASTCESPVDILAKASSENNNPLLTLLLRPLGPGRPEYLYRLPSLVFGLATVALMGAAGMRLAGRRASFLSVILGGSCFLLFVYSVEARGYSGAAFFSLLSLLSLDRKLADGGPRPLLLYWGATLLGFLFHPVALFPFLGGVAGSSVALRRGDRRPVLPALARLHAVPSILLVPCVAWVATRSSEGGHAYGTGRVLLDVANFVTGTPDLVPATLGGVLILTAAILGGIRHLRAEGNPGWILFGATVAVAPVLLVLAASAGGRALYPRYFLPVVPIALVPVSLFLERFLRNGSAWRRGAAAIAVALFLAGNGARYVRFLDHGRGDYRSAIRRMTAGADNSPVTFGARNPYKTGIVLGYYARDGRLRPVGEEERPEWLIEDYWPHFVDAFGGDDVDPVPAFAVPPGTVYRLEATFPHAGPSGARWNLYRRCDGCPWSPGMPYASGRAIRR